MQKGKMDAPDFSPGEKLTNIYHCTIHKAGSQWIKGIFRDKRVRSCTGLEPYEYEPQLEGGYEKRRVNERFFENLFPEGKVITPMYIGYENYRSIPKPPAYRAIFIIRDPRDLVISHYFSKRFSHPVQHNPGLQYIREKLNTISNTEGLKFIVDCLKQDGSFDALYSWANAPGDDENLLILRFEDLIGSDGKEKIKQMFYHLKIIMPNQMREEVLKDNSFERLSGGRKQGEQKDASHYRKGIHGDWKNYFNEEVKQYFKSITNDLTEILGYETSPGW